MNKRKFKCYQNGLCCVALCSNGKILEFLMVQSARPPQSGVPISQGSPARGGNLCNELWKWSRAGEAGRHRSRAVTRVATSVLRLQRGKLAILPGVSSNKSPPGGAISCIKFPSQFIRVSRTVQQAGQEHTHGCTPTLMANSSHLGRGLQQLGVKNPQNMSLMTKLTLI